MGTRVVYQVGFLTFAWGALALLQISLSRLYHLSPESVTVAVVSGLIAGIALGAVAALRQLRNLAKKSESRTTLTTWLYVIGSALLLGGVLILSSEFLSLSLETERLVIDSLASTVPTASATQTVLFTAWERKHKRKIMSEGLVSPRLYVFPKIDDGTLKTKATIL